MPETKTAVKTPKTVEVRALNFFMATRLNVFMENYPGVIDKDQGRTLQFGGTVEIKKSDYEGLKFYFEEAPSDG